MSKEYLVIGDGVAGATAAETLRERDKDAEIKVFTDEPEPLYNRIMLKTYMKGRLPKQYTKMHDKNWYDKRNIDLQLNTNITNINKEEKYVQTEEGADFNYDKLLIATGGSPKEFTLDEGYDNVNYMWTMRDAENIKESAENSEKSVVIGGGLLGIDLAVAYAENNSETYYLIRGDNWWSRGLDKEGAEIIHKKLEKKGVKVMTNTEAINFNVENNQVTSVETNQDDIIECDSVAIAIGQTPNSKIVDVEKNSAGMIRTDKFLQTSDSDIYAAGNMVEYNSPIFGEETVNGSWDHSEAMGEIAALNMLGENSEFDYVNTYGVGHFEAQFLAIGDWTGEPVSKKYDENHYRRLYFDEDQLIGAVMIGYTKGQESIRKMIQQKEKVQNKQELLARD